jgi:hypothetical protein
VGRSEGKSSLGSPRRRWEDNIKMDLQEVGWRGMGWIDMAQERHAVAQLVEALHYKPEGCGFDSRWCHWNF